MIGWKAFRIGKDGKLRFLFHTHNGTSVVPFNQWIEAKQKWVKDGSRAKKYRSGFHYFHDPNDIARFNKLTKNKYRIFIVNVRDVWQKPNSSVKSWLAKRLYVSEGG